MRLLAMCVVVVSACAAPMVRTTVPVHALKTPEPLSQDGVNITVDTITYDNWKSHGQIVTHIRWQEIDRNAPVLMGQSGGGRTPTVTRSDDVPLVPIPSLLVSIANQGGKPVALDHVELTDGQHHWAMMDSVGDVQGRVQSDVMGTHSVSENRPLLDALASSVAQLPIATNKSTVAPGQTWQGYLCFRIDAHDADEFNQLLDKADKLTLSLGGMTIVLPRETQQKQMMCPGGKPSLAKCKEG
jgi:hypothetical protein